MRSLFKVVLGFIIQKTTSCTLWLGCLVVFADVEVVGKKLKKIDFFQFSQHYSTHNTNEGKTYYMQ